MIRRLPASLFLALLSAATLFAAADGAWLAKVPASDHQKTNPYRAQPDAIAAGRNIFEEHCSKCHGENAEGRKKRPSLRSQRVQQQATEGDLHWLLVNGSMKKGMPSWAKLPDPQLWQLIAYLKSLHE
ncbi:MAG: c-type cytochrome [Terriglobales bacterium]|jgi:mono/diheme cytochrome c family protein